MSRYVRCMPSPEFEAVLAQMRANPVAFPDDLRAARVRIDELLGAGPLAADVTVTATTAGHRPAEWLVPAGAPGHRVVLYLHGGGYRIGSIAGYRPLISQFARAFGLRVLALEYRLAPEHPFPAGLDDAVAAYRWLLADGFAPGSIAVMGDSAGGGLAAACTLAVTQAGLAPPGAVVCLAPFADMTLSGDSYRRNAATDPQWGLDAARVAVPRLRDEPGSRSSSTSSGRAIHRRCPGTGRPEPRSAGEGRLPGSRRRRAPDHASTAGPCRGSRPSGPERPPRSSR